MNCKGGPVLDLKFLDDSTGEIEGYGSIFGGEPDHHGDIIQKGAFSKSLKEHADRGSTPKMLWQHDQREPIGSWTDAKEDDRGLMLKGRLNMQVQRGREAYALLKAGDIDGLSIGYRMEDYEKQDGSYLLKELKLFEVSVVTIPAKDEAQIENVKAREVAEIVDKLKAGDRLKEREFELLLKEILRLSNSQAERASRIHLKGPGEPVNEAVAFLKALRS